MVVLVEVVNMDAHAETVNMVVLVEVVNPLCLVNQVKKDVIVLKTEFVIVVKVAHVHLATNEIISKI